MNILQALTCKTERRIGLSAGLWISLYFVARGTLEASGFSPWVCAGIALLPLPAFAWFLGEFIRAVRDADELERRIQLEALAVAMPPTVLLIMTLGLLQVAIPLPVDDWSYRRIWPLIYVFYLIGLTLARRRYQ